MGGEQHSAESHFLERDLNEATRRIHILEYRVDHEITRSVSRAGPCRLGAELVPLPGRCRPLQM